MELITLKNIDGMYPRYLYKRLTVDNPKMNFFYKIDYGFGYLLRRIRVKYPDLNQPVLAAPPLVPTTEFTPWTALAVYVAGDIVYDPALVASMKNPPVFMCTVGGAAGAAAPAWNMLRGGTTPDGAGLLAWQTLDLAEDCGHFVSDLDVEIIDQANDNPRQPSPVKIDLMASPGRAGTLFKNVNVPGLTGTREIAWTSNQALFSSTLNFLYRYNDLIYISFSNIEYVSSIIAPDGNSHVVTPFFSPSYIDVMLEGYYVPEKAFDLWKGARL